MKKKVLSLAICAILGLSCMATAACGSGGGNDDDENSTKSVLYVSNYAGGFGKDWMDEIERRFEEKYAETSFEPNKIGVDIKVTHNKTLGSAYYDKVESVKQEVFFVEDVDYYQWANSGKMLDISDAVNSVNSEDGKTIASKMEQEEKDFYAVNGKYYAIPHHDHQAGIIYDIDLFEQEGYYFAKNGAPSEKAYTGTVKFTDGDNRSAGPDGEYGTSDDGLPATYDEFYTLCNHMATSKSATGKTIYPMIWSGQNRKDYVDWLLAELTADYEGAEQLRLNYTFDGVAKNLVSVDDAGNVTRLGDTKINTENGYLMYQTEGRLKALDFVDHIVDSVTSDVKWGDVLFGSDSQTVAQDKYVYGAAGINGTRYAFLVDGTWWKNEAADTFKNASRRTAGLYSEDTMRFGLLPLPKATSDKIGEPFTLATTEVTVGFVKSNIKASKIDLAKTFMKFVYADEQLAAFNTVSGMPASLSYTLSDAQYEELTGYEKSLYDVKDNAVLPYSTNPVYINNYKSLMLKSTFTAKGNQAVESLRSTSAINHFKLLYSASGRNEISWKSLLAK